MTKDRDPTIEELGEMAHRNAPKQPQREPEQVDPWLAKILANAPPPMTPEEVEAEERRQRHFKLSKVQERLPRFLQGVRMRAMLDRIPSESFRSAAASWTPTTGSALLMGDTGRGKTTAAGVMALRVLREGLRSGGTMWEMAQGIRWFRAEELERAMRAHPLGRGEAPAYHSAINAKLLVLDELGWEKDHKAMASVLATRYDGGGLTIVTTGQCTDDLRQTYGDAIIRRVITFRGRPAMLVSDFAADQEPRETPRHPVGHAKNPQPPTEVN